ncbi:hypothetical protein CYLTODRAFT_422341 [Cylindrobasidium torrendii FP15055 ss-10]|uniref:C2H2-type domain-containing protein n=1 Tax=Cylindrobasidium torrendii FP15055 ss-10 TaxID=1314674 RepID=A0A0D7BBR4_9AGAR|nr:hypothetical protein CYLTODRAFT_422341 [Cylindrobasidium torrendii FP15055 ss-10]
MIFICRVPSCKFNTRCIKQFTKHSNRHTPRTPYACIFGDCSYATRKRQDFDLHQLKHVRQRPPEPEEFPSPCLWPACISVSPDIKKYRRHARRHTFEEPFVCGYSTCHCKFAEYEDLLLHYDSHNDSERNQHNKDISNSPKKRKRADRELDDGGGHNIQPSATFERSPSLEHEPPRKRRLQVYVSVPRMKGLMKSISHSRTSTDKPVAEGSQRAIARRPTSTPEPTYPSPSTSQHFSRSRSRSVSPMDLDWARPRLVKCPF